MKAKLFPYIIALSALAVSASAATYSVYGLSKLFAGASLAVMIMAGSLEFAKLVIASVLYQYWNKLNKYIRIYLFMAVLVLITITSGGIYGFLSGAYQETANQSELISKNLNILETKQNRYISRLNDLEVTGDVGMPDISVSGNVEFGSHLVGTSTTANSVINGKFNVLNFLLLHSKGTEL